MNEGTRIGEHVVLEDMIGGGALGVVWRGRHEALACPVAVKLLIAMDADARDRFEVEGKIIARLHSPNIVRVLDCGTHDGVPYLVMELIDGETLRERLNRDGVLEPSLVADIVEQVAKGLEHAHRRGVIHRDIKPDNIFLTHDDQGELRVVIVDFGIAKPGWSIEGRKPTNAGMLVGSPSYMSPEQLVSATSVTPGSDTWSLAIVAYEALTGRVPFGDEDDLSHVVRAILRREYAAELDRDLPSLLEPIFSQAFHRDAGSRFRSSQAFARALALTLEEAAEPVLLTRESKVHEEPEEAPQKESSVAVVPMKRRAPGWMWGGAVLAVLGALWAFGRTTAPVAGASVGVGTAVPRFEKGHGIELPDLPMPSITAPRSHSPVVEAGAPPAATHTPAPHVPPATPPPTATGHLPTRTDYGF